MVSDEDSETTVSIARDADTQEILRKLRKVLELVAPVPREAVPPAAPRYAPPPTGQPTNGWASYVQQQAPELPARLAGEVEMIPEGEDA
ncbi:hypothetical protein [Streptomyces hoynatensis]|uniref:hypothetical protein n=1 Tax=Streptomyces hoynatensis TaxID=1141874 RepID=UPI0011C46238|nr:hypothetical protein [Streptomyces hoynatensis]